MKYIADLHIHSKYSRATSKQLDLEHVWVWAQIKGISVVATGDCVHPGWLAEIMEKLEPSGDGLLALKKKYADTVIDEVPEACRGPVHFLLAAEISSIYKRDDRVRKVHNIVYAPDVATARTIQARLESIGNIRSDGRPILGLDARDLLSIVLDAGHDAFLIPAHIWTPWFSMLGSKSGFNSVEECFGDLTKHIFALETGLSSDPLMNWRLSILDPFVLVSNSDAHSPAKLGREANIFDTELAYGAIVRALRDPDDTGFVGTIEFFPEEGKYHFDGHRKCRARLHPQETMSNNGICPVCGKAVTVGVMARVEELADRPEGVKGRRARPYHRCIPLQEIIADAMGVGASGKRVIQMYNQLVASVGNEFYILREADSDVVESVAGPLVAEGIRRVREGRVKVAAGYDGEFGTITIFSNDERRGMAGCR